MATFPHLEQAQQLPADRPPITWESLHHGLSMWAFDQGWPYGCPLPSIGASKARLIIARRAPFGNRERPILSWPEISGEVPIREFEYEADDWLHIVNHWIGRDGIPVNVCEREAETRYREMLGFPPRRIAYRGKHPCSERLDRLIETLGVRLGAVVPRSEARAMMNLADRLTDSQANSYVLNGAFLETSQRSKVTYLFRKGYPTIAMKANIDGKSLRFLAALCMHPLAFFEDTHAGSMAPSDDVLAHLLLMRADEHLYWRNCNQHPMFDTRSGI